MSFATRSTSLPARSGLLAAGISRLALAAALTAAAPALAQQQAPQVAQAQPAAKTSELEEIVVTARHEKESVQQTPIAITALSGEQMQARGYTNVIDVAREAPNVALDQQGASYGKSVSAFIRGIGQQDFDYAYEPGVGFYIDDVYHGTVFGSAFDLTDIEHVEIERGPQGTLNGKNNEGGAVKIYTNRATGDDSGDIEVGYGSYNKEQVKGGFDIALVPNQLYLRVYGGAVKSDGYVDVIDWVCSHPGQGNGVLKAQTTAPGCKTGEEGGQDARSFRANLRYVPNNDLEININADVLDDSGQAQPEVGLDYGKPGTFTGFFNAATESTFGLVLNNKQFVAPHYETYASFSSPWNGLSFQPLSTVFSYGFGVTVDYETPIGIHVKDIVAYRKYDGQAIAIESAAPLETNDSFNTVDHHQFSEELDLTGKLLDDRLDWATGAYYYTGFSENGGRVDIPALLGLSFDINDPVEDHNTSGFLHGIYHITDDLSFEAGTRYTSEDKTYTFYRFVEPSGIPGALNGIVWPLPGCSLLGPPPCGLPGTALFTGKAADSRFDARVGLTYQITPDINTYASLSTGYKGGGINPRPTGPQAILPFKPEDLVAYELGEKGEFFDHSLRFNTALFVNNFKDLQLTVLGTGANAGGTLVGNAGHVLIYGWEGEVTARPISGLELGADWGWIHQHTITLGTAEYNPVTNAQGIQLGWHQIRVPTWKFGLNAQYAYDMGDLGTLTPRADFTFQTTVFNDITNTQDGKQGDYALTNLHLMWDSADGLWGANFSVDNAFDRYYFIQKFNLEYLYGHTTGEPGLPRTFMFTVHRSFAAASAPAAYSPPPAPAATPAAPPAQPTAQAPEAQRSFQVFFDFDKSSITDAAAKVIQAAADNEKAGHFTQINVTGHTDTVGSAKYNQALSERRAAAVKQQLIADGVPAAEISAAGVGKTGLLVPTADGVREPQNRRAEIVLQ